MTLDRPPGSGVAVRYFGDYEILEELGRGGMGVVYKARQVNLNRSVALKMILSGQLAGENEIRRFYLEAEAAAGLDHPGIVPVYEVGEHQGQHYFSMGYVEGRSLALEVASGPLQPREAAALVLQVAEAVQYAHDRGVIHRDIKPSNILLDNRGRPRVTDFGLAKLIQSDSSLTHSGLVLGSPGYMPPEQAGGGLAAVSPSSDIFSLGATLYCLITGRTPFQAPSVMETIRRTLEEEPTPPRKIRPSLSKDLDTICLKCLRKEPERRYASARDLAKDLARHLSAQAILARPVSTTERAWLWARRYPTVAGLSASVMVLTMVTTLALAMAFRRPSESHSLAVEKVGGSKPPTVVEKVGESKPPTAPSTPAQGTLAFELPDPRVRVELENGGQLVGVSGSGIQEVRLLSGRHRIKVTAGGNQVLEKTLEIAPGERRTIQEIMPTTSTSPTSENQSGLPPGGRLPTNFSTESLLVTDNGGHHATVCSLLFTPTGSRILSGGIDKVIRVWDVDGGPRLERTIRPPIWKGYRGQIYAMALSSVVDEGNQRILAVGGYGASASLGEILLYRYPGQNPQGTGELMARLPSTPLTDEKVPPGESPGHDNVVTSLAFTPDGRFLASASQDRTVRIWEVATKKLVAVLHGPQAEVNTLAIFANGTRLVTGGNDGHIRLYDITNPSPPRLIKQAPPGPGPGGEKPDPLASRITTLAVSSDDRWIVMGTEGGVLSRFDAATLGEAVALPLSLDRKPPTGPVLALALSRDGRFMATSFITRNVSQTVVLRTESSVVRVHSMPDGAILETMPTTSNLVQAIAFSPDSQRLAYAGGDSHEIIVRDSSAWNASPIQLKGRSTAVWDVGFSPDNRRIRLFRVKSSAPGGANDSVSFDLLERRVSHPDRGDLSRQALVSVAGWALRPIDQYRFDCINSQSQVAGQISLDPINERRWWTYTVIPPGPDHPQPVAAIATDNGGIVLWNLTTLSKTRLLNAHAGPVYTLASSPDGKWLVSGSSDQTVRLWPLAGCDRPPPFGARFERMVDGTWVVANVTPGSFADGIALKKGLVLEKFFIGNYGPPKEIEPSEFDQYLPGLDLETPTSMLAFSGRMPGMAIPFQAATTKRDSSCLSLLLGTDDEWVIWTPQGYYDSSIRGDEGLGWHRNLMLSGSTHPSQVTEFVPARTFEVSIRQPLLIDELIRTADFGRLAASGRSTTRSGLSRLAILSIDAARKEDGREGDYREAARAFERAGVRAGYHRIESRVLRDEAATESRVRMALDDLDSGQSLGRGDQLVLFGDLGFANRSGELSTGQLADSRLPLGEALRRLASRGCRVLLLVEVLPGSTEEAEIRESVRGLNRDGVIVLMVTADGVGRPQTLARGILETLAPYLSGAMMTEPRGIFTLESFLDGLSQAILRISQNHRFSHYYIPQAVSPKSPFMDVPPAPRTIESVGEKTKPGR